jgi:uncharacterized Ntn-hydrolase superfamily protein
MTFSLIARDAATGAFGMVVTSSSPSVAARCIHLRAGTGAAASQNITDPQLGTWLLDLLEAGSSADEAVARLAQEPDIEYRQLTVVGPDGRTAAFSGGRTLGTHRTVELDGAVAAGNLLSSSAVVDAIAEAYAAAGGGFEDRLLAGLLAGRDAGGEEGPEHSAGLAVVDPDVPWPVTDLRVDWADQDPVGQLAALWELWRPQKADYKLRAVRPALAPSYGVPGDL